MRGLVRLDQAGKTLTLTATGKQPAGGFQSLPAGERAIFSWVNEMGAATIDKAHGERVAKVGTEFTTSIEKENRNRFFRRNFGFVIAGLAMTALVVVSILAFGGLSNDDTGIMIGAGFIAFFGTMFIASILQLPQGGGVKTDILARAVMTLAFVAVLLSIAVNILQGVMHDSPSQGLPMLRALVENYSFPLVLVAAFASLNGLFVFLMRAPTALGRPVMDQLTGFRLYLETAEADRLNMQAPELTAERFEALLPYAVALDVEKPWAHAFAAALRRAHPEDADPMRHYQPGWVSGGSGWSSGDFGGAVASTVGGVSGAFAGAVPASSSGFGGGGGSGGGGW